MVIVHVQLKAGKISSFMARYLDGKHYMDASNLVLTDDVLAAATENVRDDFQYYQLGFLISVVWNYSISLK